VREGEVRPLDMYEKKDLKTESGDINKQSEV